MLYSEIIAVCSQIHTKHINTLCGQNVECRTYRAVNTLRLSYKNQSANAVQWNNFCWSSNPHKAHNFRILFFVLHVQQDLKTEVLLPSRHLTTLPVTRRHISKDATPLLEPQICQLINMSGDVIEWWDLLNTEMSWATVSFWRKAELRVTLCLLAESGRPLQPTKYTQGYFIILQHVSDYVAVCSEISWYNHWWEECTVGSSAVQQYKCHISPHCCI